MCDHPARQVIERMLREGKPYLYISKFFLVSEGSLINHKRNHMETDVKLKKGEVLAEWKMLSEDGNWSSYDLMNGEKAVGKCYLDPIYRPVNKRLLLTSKQSIYTVSLINETEFKNGRQEI